MTTQTAILIGLIIYGCLMAAVSLFFMTRVKKAADYFVAGRGLPREVCMMLSGAITAMISIPGGLKTVVYTDFLQAAILLCGFGCLTEVALSQSGGLVGLRAAVCSPTSSSACSRRRTSAGSKTSSKR